MTTIVELIASIKSEGAKKTQDDLLAVGRAGKKSGREVESGTDTMSAGLKSAAIGVGKLWAAYKGSDILISVIAQSAQLAARYETLGTVMNTVTGNMGISASSAETLATSVQRMGITMSQSRNTIISMAQAQLDMSKASELARVSQDAAVIAGIDSSEALGRIIYGIKTAQTETLRTVGINVNFERSYQKLARELNKTSATLTEGERAQARMNAVMDEGRRVAGAYEAAMTTAGKKVTSLARQQEDLATKFGGLFTSSYSLLVEEFTNTLKNLNAEMDKLGKNGGAKEVEEDISLLTAATISAGKAAWSPLVVLWNLAQASGGALAGVISGDLTYAMNELADAGEDIVENWEGIFSAFRTMQEQANTFTFTKPTGQFDDIGLEIFETYTQTFYDLDDAQKEFYAKLAANQAQARSDVEGVRSSFNTLDNEMTDAITKQLNAQRQKNSLIGAEGAYQQQLAQFREGNLRQVDELLNMDREQLSNDIAALDSAIAYYRANEDTLEGVEGIAAVEQRRAELMAKMLLLQNGLTAELKEQLLAEAKRTDVSTAQKQIEDKRFEISLIGKSRAEVAALTAQRQLERKSLHAQGAEMANLIRLEHERRAAADVGTRIADIELETRLIGATAREHEIATSAVRLHRDGWHELATAIEEATARQYDAQAKFNIESKADPSIERNRAIRELNMLYSEGEREGAGYRRALDEINDAYIRQVDVLGQLTQMEARALASNRSRIELESARNATAYSDRAQTHLETLMREDELTEKRIVSLQAEIDMLMSKNEVDEVAVNAAMSRMERLKQQAGQFEKTFRDVGEGGMQTFFQEILDGTSSVEEAFDSMVDNIVSNMARIAAQQISESIMGGITGGAGGAGGAGFFSSAASFFGFSKGGIMTKKGPLPLKRYASGGVANNPQLAVFGEGAMPEAYVPLPDGKSIPVKVEGDKGAEVPQQPIIVNVSVTRDVSPKSASQTGYSIGRAISVAQRRNS